MNYERVKRLTKLCDVVSKIVEGVEFVELKVGTEGIGGMNFRIKGRTLYSNIAGIPNVSYSLPDVVWNKIVKLREKLVDQLKTEVQSLF